MPHFIHLPEEVAAVFGNAAPKFVDFLASTFTLQRDEVVHMSVLSFEKTLEKEVSSVRLEVAELRAEMKADFADVHREIAGLHEKISAVHREITVQTRWILIGLLSAATLYPIITRLALQFL